SDDCRALASVAVLGGRPTVLAAAERPIGRCSASRRQLIGANESPQYPSPPLTMRREHGLMQSALPLPAPRCRRFRLACSLKRLFHDELEQKVDVPFVGYACPFQGLQDMLTHVRQLFLGSSVSTLGRLNHVNGYRTQAAGVGGEGSRPLGGQFLHV